MYVESSGADDAYYLDNITIKMTTPPPLDQSDIKTDFENGTIQGWEPRIGHETLTVTQEDKKNGQYSLLVTGRQYAYSGPKINVFGKMHKDHKYNLSVWVKLAPGESPTDMRLSIQRSLGSNVNYDTVVPNSLVTADNWVLLSASYQMRHTVDSLSAYVETASELASFYIDDFELVHIPPLPIQVDIPSLKDVFAQYFTIGAAIEPYQTTGMHGDMLKKHYNVIVAENVMKPGLIQPVEDTFNWTDSDLLFQFAEANNMKVRFHTLVWHQQTADWFFLDLEGKDMTLETDPVKREANKELLLQRLESHITAIVNRYKGRVDSWDVVNEVIDPNTPNGMRNSKWYQITGTEYIERAFRLVRELDPTAKLFINDYNTHDPAKRDFLYNLVVELKGNGVPIDGVGHQTHINIQQPSLSSIAEPIEKFGEIGLDNQITELDVSVYTDNNTSYQVVPHELLAEQGYRYKELFEELKRLGEKGYISNVTFWGIADDHSWLHNRPIPRRDAPFVFDEQFQAKPAYWGIVDPIKLEILIQKRDVINGNTCNRRRNRT